DLAFDTHKFPHPQNMITELHHEGHLVKLAIHPFVSDHSTLKKAHHNFLIHNNANGQPLNVRMYNESGALYDYSLYQILYKHLNPHLSHLSQHFGVDSYRFE